MGDDSKRKALDGAEVEHIRERFAQLRRWMELTCPAGGPLGTHHRRPIDAATIIHMIPDAMRDAEALLREIDRVRGR